MATITYTINITSGTNIDLKNGGTVGGTITRNGGSPGSGTITSASLYISSITCYTTLSPYLELGSYGTTGQLPTGSSTSMTVGASVNSNILNVSNSGITITIRSSGTGNAVNVRTGCYMTLTVNYTESGGGGTPGGYDPLSATLSKNNVYPGDTITASIYGGQGGLSYNQTWTFGTKTITNTNPLTVPDTWLNEIPSTVSGTGVLTVSTYAGYSYVGANSYTFTVNVPANAVPSLTNVTATRLDNDVNPSWGIYVQNRSGVSITANGAAGVYGSAIASYTISGGANASYGTNTYMVPIIQQSGSVEYVVRVTDSRGRSVSKSVVITVHPYSNPTFTTSMAFRCLSTGEANEKGTFAGVRAGGAFSSCNGRNSIAMSASFARIDSSTWLDETEQIADTDTVIGDGALDENYSYRVRFTLQDAFTTIIKIVDVNTASYIMFFKRGGQGVAFGKVAEREMALEISPDWTIWHGSTNLIEKINDLETRLAALGG